MRFAPLAAEFSRPPPSVRLLSARPEKLPDAFRFDSVQLAVGFLICSCQLQAWLPAHEANQQGCREMQICSLWLTVSAVEDLSFPSDRSLQGCKGVSPSRSS